MALTNVDRKDLLALDRTKLANERTFLAYFRTSIVFLSSALAILKLKQLEAIESVGYYLLILSPIIFAIGLIRFIVVHKRIKGYYKQV